MPYGYSGWLQWSHRTGFHEIRVILRHFSLFSASVKMPFVQTVVGVCGCLFRVAVQTGKYLKRTFLQVCDYFRKFTRRTDMQQCNDIQPSQSFATVSISSEIDTEGSYDSHEKDQEESENTSILAIFRDNIWIVFDEIMNELSSRSVLNLALTESTMYVALLPVLEKRKAKWWTFLRTPRQYPRTQKLLSIVGRNETLKAAMSYMSEEKAICFTGCCTPPLTDDRHCQYLLQRYRKKLRLGDRLICHFIGLIHVVVNLQVIESKTCKEHPLQLGSYAIFL